MSRSPGRWRWLLLLPLLAAACASPPSANLREIYQTSKTGDQKTRNMTSLLEVGLEDEVGPDLEYRVSERLIREDTDFSVGSFSQSTRRMLHQPSVDLILTSGFLKWTQGYDYQKVTTNPRPGENNDRTSTEILQRIDWTPLDLPRVTAWVDYQNTNDDLFLDRDETLSLVEVEEVRGPFSYILSQRDQRIEDNRADVTEDRTDRSARVTYRDEHLDDKLTTSLSLFTENRHTVSEADAGSDLLPPNEILPMMGFAGIDTTPAISTLPQVPGLVDGDDTTPLGINIGGFSSGGELFWNMAVSQATEEPIERILLYTQDELDAFFAQQFSFSVWASEDNAFWTLVTGSANVSYEGPLRRFRIAVPKVEAPFIKVVNTASPAAAPAVLVTELRIFGPNPGGQGSSRIATREKTRNATGGLGWRASDKLSLSYDVFVQTVDRETDDVTTRDEDRVDNTISALWSPTEIVDVSLRATDRSIDDSTRYDEDFRSYNGLVSIQPIEALDVAFNYTSTEQDRDGDDDFDTNAAQGRVAAQLLDTLTAEVAYEQNEQDDYRNDRTVKRDIISASTTANVTRDLDVTLSYRDVSADVSGTGADQIPNPDEQITELLLVYQPSDQLTAEVDLEWRDTFAGSGLDQRLRLDWLPFPDGSIDIQLDFQRRSSDIDDSGSDRFQVLTRWTMNPQAFVELNHAIQVPEEGDRTTTTSLGLNVRF